MSMTETVKYLDNLDSAVTKANEALHNTVMTSAGKINQNSNLDGFRPIGQNVLIETAFSP